MTETGRISRRRFLGGLGAAGAGAGLGAVAVAAHAQTPDPVPTGSGVGAGARVDFHGVHQAGIGTASQDRLAFAAFDVTTKDADALRRVLTEWTAAAVAMTRGVPVPGSSSDPMAPPADTGEARGLPPSALTVTVGFGPTLFDERFGLGEPSSGGAGADPGAARRRAAAAAGRWRPRHPGLLERPAGRLPRHPQPRPDRQRLGGDALVAARVRAHVVHLGDPVHAPQPDGLQGRHAQHPRRGHRRHGQARLGRRRVRPGLDARRLLPGVAADPDAGRVLGPRLPRRPAGRLRSAQGQRRAARPGRTSSTRRTTTPRARTASR